MASDRPSFTLRAVCRLFLVVMWTLICLVLASPLRLIMPPVWWWVSSLWKMGLVKIFALKVVVKGHPVKGKAVLFVSNHISWKDIIVYGAVIKHISFISKAEISKNPIARFVAGYQRTLFIQRKRRQDSKKQNETMVDRLVKGDSLMLFPEGRTTRGLRVDRFKTALFAAVEMWVKKTDKPQIVQPVSICYTHANNLPILLSSRTKIGLIGHTNGWHHFIHALRRRSTRVVVDFHPPITVNKGSDRKQIAALCHDAVSHGLTDGHHDRGNTGKT